MSKWRETYKVHPAADVFPMMSDEELDALGQDIKANGLRVPLLFSSQGEDHVLLDGRNRLEAMERAGITIETDRFGLPDRYRGTKAANSTHTTNPVAYIIGLNIRRRHLTKAQQADLIVAAHKAAEDKPRQVGEVSGGKVWVMSPCGTPLWETQYDTMEEWETALLADAAKGGRGKVDKTKAAIVSTAAEHGISKRTVERAIAKANGKTPRKRAAASVIIEDDDPAPLGSVGRVWRRGLLACCKGEVLKDASRHVEWFEQHPKAINDSLVSEVYQACIAWEELHARLADAQIHPADAAT
jgi:hypothetical protein